MLAMEEVVCEVSGGDEEINEQGLPPGFRFHPTDEELITFYLASKVFNFNGSFCGVNIAEIDLNRCEPWELPEVAKMGEREWYLFSLRDRKYPTGLRTNRATGAGYWKATGKDREVYSGGTTTTTTSGALIGMKKTLVFYKGRAPRGEKTKWVMHEFRLHGHFSTRPHPACKEEWVICRIVHKLIEKKNPNFQGQHHMLEACSSSPTISGALSTLLFETPKRTRTRTTTLIEESQYSNNPLMQAIQNPFLNHHQESDHLKSLIITNPVVSQPNLFHTINDLKPSFSPAIPSFPTSTTTTNNKVTNPQNNPSTALFNSLLSHQDFTLKEQPPVPKQCKTEANFSHFQQSDANMRWVDKIHPNPLFFGTDWSVMGYSSSSSSLSASDTVPVQDMSTSMPFNRAGFQMLVDPPSIGITGQSWPWDF